MDTNPTSYMRLASPTSVCARRAGNARDNNLDLRSQPRRRFPDTILIPLGTQLAMSKPQSPLKSIPNFRDAGAFVNDQTGQR
jgi:hypothetical protein